MLNKQLMGAILPGGVRTKLNVFVFILLAFVSLASCEDPMSDVKVDDVEITSGACEECKNKEEPPTNGGG